MIWMIIYEKQEENKMRANILEGLIYCNKCNEYKNSTTEIYLPGGSENEGSINCLHCDTIIGYTHDEEWKQLFKIT